MGDGRWDMGYRIGSSIHVSCFFARLPVCLGVVGLCSIVLVCLERGRGWPSWLSYMDDHHHLAGETRLAK